jgi:Ca2+-binding EF-hand superfamily protein
VVKVADTTAAGKKASAFDPSVKSALESISKYLKTNNRTSDEQFDLWDRNRNQSIDRQEFIDGVTSVREFGISAPTAGKIFDSIDHENSGLMSKNAFNLYIQGIQLTKEKRAQNLPAFVREDLKAQVLIAFKDFDKDGNNRLDAKELQQGLKAVGQMLSIEDVNAVIAANSRTKQSFLSYQEFEDLLMPLMIEKILSAEDNVQHLR